MRDGGGGRGEGSKVEGGEDGEGKEKEEEDDPLVRCFQCVCVCGVWCASRLRRLQSRRARPSL